jgi:hypothetical protein
MLASVVCMHHHDQMNSTAVGVILVAAVHIAVLLRETLYMQLLVLCVRSVAKVSMHQMCT